MEQRNQFEPNLFLFIRGKGLRFLENLEREWDGEVGFILVAFYLFILLSWNGDVGNHTVNREIVEWAKLGAARHCLSTWWTIQL